MAHPALVPSLIYRDPEAAMHWLERAFGFEIDLVVRDEHGKAVHIEMQHEGAFLYVGGDTWNPNLTSPSTIGGKNTSVLSLSVTDVSAHYARAKAAGTRIVAEPEDQFYGDRVYRALDVEGHLWTFHQKVRDVSIEEMERVTGHKMVTAKK